MFSEDGDAKSSSVLVGAGRITCNCETFAETFNPITRVTGESFTFMISLSSLLWKRKTPTFISSKLGESQFCIRIPFPNIVFLFLFLIVKIVQMEKD